MKKFIFSKSLLKQSLPTLLFSLLSLSLAGKWLDESLSESLYVKYPLMLISSCILTFKGNIELILAMHLSTLSQSRNLDLSKYHRFAFDNSCLVITQSVFIGLMIGILGGIKNFLSKDVDINIIIKIMASVLVSCFFSTVCILLIMVVSIKLSLLFNIDPDHIVLPGISSFGDFFGVRTCIYFIKYFHFATPQISAIVILLILLITIIPFYFSLVSKKIIPQQTIEVLLLTYLLSASAGYILDFFSKNFKILAIYEPVFCGMCCSTVLIYLNKRVTSIENRAEMNNQKVFSTLLLISFSLGAIYMIFFLFFINKFLLSFFLLFVALFTLNIFILLYFIKLIIDSNSIANPNIGVFAIPLISSLSDFTGVLMSIFIILCVSLLQVSFLD